MDGIFSKSYTRREMLELMMKAGAGTFVISAGMQMLFMPSANAAMSPGQMRKALFYTKLPAQKVKCTLCPREITIDEGKSCFCKTRKNIGGELYAIGYDKPCIVNFEPVERAPLYHFKPSTETMSMGAAGCNLNCLYCQNYKLAQSSPEKVDIVNIDTAAALRKGKASSITLTYTDAACQPEYLMMLSAIARKNNIPLILCTGAYINPGALKEIIPFVDAFAVTYKAATDDMYQKLTGIHLKPVQESIKLIVKSKKWLELITLVVPDYNDDRKGIEGISSWIADNAGDKIPWHISRFTPDYKLTKLPPTPRKTLEEARELGLKAGLKYVYITNLAPHEGNHTYCHSCGKKIIERLGFQTKSSALKNGSCPYCNTPIPGIWS